MKVFNHTISVTITMYLSCTVYQFLPLVYENKRIYMTLTVSLMMKNLLCVGRHSL